MKKQMMVLMMAILLMVSAAAMAMTTSDDHGSMKSMDHGDMKKMDHGNMGAGMIMLPDVEVDGVMASTHLIDSKAKMAKLGMSMTHHLMVGFMTSDGEDLPEGRVAVKVQSPDGTVSKANKMMAMKGQFGTDVTLDQKGTYMFMVGTKLADGRKRMFHLSFENK